MIRSTAPLTHTMATQTQTQTQTQTKRDILYWIDARNLVALNKPGFWKEMGLNGLVVFPNLPGIDPYIRPLDKSSIDHQLESISKAIHPDTKKSLAIRCYSETPPHTLLRKSDDDDGWQLLEDNLDLLAKTLSLHKFDTLFIDCEYYPATPNASGGNMNKSAWQFSSEEDARDDGGLMSLCLKHQNIKSGLYVWLDDVKRRTGWKWFANEFSVSNPTPNSKIMGEEFINEIELDRPAPYKNNARFVKDLGAEYYAGIGWSRNPRHFHNCFKIAYRAAKGKVWIYPYGSEAKMAPESLKEVQNVLRIDMG